MHGASCGLRASENRHFYKVSPTLLSKAAMDFASHPTLATAMLREQRGKNDICFPAVDTSITQDGGESPALFNVVMTYLLRPQCLQWKRANIGKSDQERTWRCCRRAAGHTRGHTRGLRGPLHLLAGRTEAPLCTTKEATEMVVEHGLEWTRERWSTRAGDKIENYTTCNSSTKTRSTEHQMCKS